MVGRVVAIKIRESTGKFILFRVDHLLLQYRIKAKPLKARKGTYVIEFKIAMIRIEWGFEHFQQNNTNMTLK